MTWFRRRRRRAIALALSAAALAVVAPTAVAATWEDTHSEDGAASGAASRLDAQSAGDLRSPDARDAGLASEQQVQAQAYRDLRSPDARDAGRGVATGSQPAATPAPVDTRTVITVQEKGSQTLAIVFSATALLIALLSVGFLALARRPRARWTAP